MTSTTYKYQMIFRTQSGEDRIGKVDIEIEGNKLEGEEFRHAEAFRAYSKALAFDGGQMVDLAVVELITAPGFRVETSWLMPLDESTVERRRTDRRSPYGASRVFVEPQSE